MLLKIRRRTLSEYQLNNLLKDEFKGKLPTIEESERELRN